MQIHAKICLGTETRAKNELCGSTVAWTVEVESPLTSKILVAIQTSSTASPAAPYPSYLCICSCGSRGRPGGPRGRRLPIFHHRIDGGLIEKRGGDDRGVHGNLTRQLHGFVLTGSQVLIPEAEKKREENL